MAIIVMIAFTSANANPVVTLPTKVEPTPVKMVFKAPVKSFAVQPVLVTRVFRNAGTSPINLVQQDNYNYLSLCQGGQYVCAIVVDDDAIEQGDIEDALASINLADYSNGSTYTFPATWPDASLRGKTFVIYKKNAA